MLSSTVKKTKIPQFFSFQLKNVHFKDNKVNINIKYDINKDTTQENLEKFEKEYLPTHWIYDYLPKFGSFIAWGDSLKVFDTDKDSELGRYKWNSNGCYPNRLSNIFYRSKAYL